MENWNFTERKKTLTKISFIHYVFQVKKTSKFLLSVAKTPCPSFSRL